MQFRDYYRVLGVARDATPADVKHAYRKLARRYHPDVNAGDAAAEQRFKELNEAHEVLGNPDSRRRYDELGADWRRHDPGQAPGGADPFAGAPFAGAPFGFGGGPGAFSDFFETFFGAGAGAGAARPPHDADRGRDVEHVIELGLEQAFRGSTQRLRVRGGGRQRPVDVRIPAGVGDGALIRVRGAGGSVRGGSPAGDLLLRVRVRPHPRFTLRDRDLHLDLDVPLASAVLGGHVDVATLDGQTVRLRIPPATQPGQVFRLRGRGLPGDGRGSPAGDLLATARVAVPRKLSARARAHWEALLALEQTERKSTRTVA